MNIHELRGDISIRKVENQPFLSKIKIFLDGKLVETIMHLKNI